MERTEIASEKIMHDLQAVVTDTEALLQATAGDASELAVKARIRVKDSLRNARARVVEVERQMTARARRAAQATNGYVHENPWPTIGVAAGVGFLAGVLLLRR